MSSPSVLSVSIDGAHRFSKAPADTITLVAGTGVQGDAHAGVTVQHRSRVAADLTQFGENITSRGVPLLGIETAVRGSGKWNDGMHRG